MICILNYLRSTEGLHIKDGWRDQHFVYNSNAPIIGLPQDGGVGQPRGIRLRKAHVGWDFDIHNGPRGRKFDSTAILKS